MCQTAGLVYLSCAGNRKTHHHHFNQLGIKISKFERSLTSIRLERHLQFDLDRCAWISLQRMWKL